MGPPGGGRNAITPRFLRHFNICSINAFSDNTMVHIFSNIVAFHLKNNEFPPEYFTVGNQIVTATMEVSKTAYFSPLIIPIGGVFYIVGTPGITFSQNVFKFI